MNIELLWSQYQEWIMVGIVFIAALLYLFFWINNRKLHKTVNQFSVIKEMIRTVNPEKGLEENMNQLLELIAGIVHAPTYTFYMLDKKNESYLLKAVRYQSEDFGNVRPSYSGLVSFEEDTYMPPLSLSISKRVYEIKKIVEGEVPLFFIPVGDKGLILIGPLENVKNSTLSKLENLSNEMSYMLEGLIISEEIRSQAQVVVASGKALQKISNISMDSKMMMEMMIKLCVQSINASGGFFVQQEEDVFRVLLHVGMDKTTLHELNHDSETLEVLFSYVDQEEFHFIGRSDEQYYNLPSYFAAAGMETLTIMKLGSMQEDGFFVLWFEEGKKKRDHEVKIVLNTMIDHVRLVMGYQSGLRQFSNTYLDILKMLAKLVDNLNPFTIGYSEMMSRYSVIIARQLELKEEEVRDVALAAYLSNIGVLGLSNSLFEKEGEFSDEEYELIKLHSEVGASIVNVATGNERLAAYIMHHHERMDGHGYPDGLKDEEIPVGSKIIAVVQTFLAKINGRKYREPLAFNEAIQLLESAAGAQLDENIVTTFTDWYKEKRLESSIKGRPLGTCSEMLCVPSSICNECPVSKNRDVPCWEVENNLCQAHGKSCETCVVRTESMTRFEM